MIAPLAKFIDWSVLQMAYAVFGLKHAPKPKWKLEEALEFLNGVLRWLSPRLNLRPQSHSNHSALP